MEQRVRTVVFGPAPERGAARNYVGVPRSRYSPHDVEAVLVKEYTNKEKLARHTCQLLQERMQTPTGRAPSRSSDVMPGYASISEVYSRIGYELNPHNRRVAPPTVLEPPGAYADSMTSRRSVRSASAASLPSSRSSRREAGIRRSGSTSSLREGSPSFPTPLGWRTPEAEYCRMRNTAQFLFI